MLNLRSIFRTTYLRNRLRTSSRLLSDENRKGPKSDSSPDETKPPDLLRNSKVLAEIKKVSAELHRLRQEGGDKTKTLEKTKALSLKLSSLVKEVTKEQNDLKENATEDTVTNQQKLEMENMNLLTTQLIGQLKNVTVPGTTEDISNRQKTLREIINRQEKKASKDAKISKLPGKHATPIKEEFKGEVEEKMKSLSQKLNEQLKDIIKPKSDVDAKVQVTMPPLQRERKTPKKHFATEYDYKVSLVAEKVAIELEDNVNKVQTELINYLQSIGSKPSEGLKDVIKGIQIKTGKEERQSRKLMEESVEEISFEPFFPSEGLNILKRGESRTEKVQTRVWNDLEEEEAQKLTWTLTKDPYEEMIRWTEEGKLWHFPIDNEQGLFDEDKVDFTEHVFLEEYLEPWCPHKGPIRDFMDLVLVGLSKNPYIRVEDKKEHIFWFRDYFESKKKILNEAGYSVEEIMLGKPKELTA